MWTTKKKSRKVSTQRSGGFLHCLLHRIFSSPRPLVDYLLITLVDPRILIWIATLISLALCGINFTSNMMSQPRRSHLSLILMGLLVTLSTAFRRPTTETVPRIGLVSGSLHNRHHSSKTTVMPAALCLRGGEGIEGISDKEKVLFVIGSIATIPLCEKIDISPYCLGYLCLYFLSCLNDLFVKLALPSKVEVAWINMSNVFWCGAPMFLVGTLISRIFGRIDLRKPPNRMTCDVLFGSSTFVGFLSACLEIVNGTVAVPLAIIWFLACVGAQEIISPRVDNGSWTLSSQQLKVLDVVKKSQNVACAVLVLSIYMTNKT